MGDKEWMEDAKTTGKLRGAKLGARPKLTVSRKLHVPTDLNDRLVKQHARLGLLHDTIPRRHDHFLLLLLDSAVTQIESEEHATDLVITPKGISPDEMKRIQAQLQELKRG